MADKIAFTSADRWLLQAFPAFLAYIAMRTAGGGWLAYFDGAIAFFTGFAVVKGINAALGPPVSLTPQVDERILSTIRPHDAQQRRDPSQS